jgi:hypothetical protein
MKNLWVLFINAYIGTLISSNDNLLIIFIDKELKECFGYRKVNSPPWQLWSCLEP